MQLNSKETCIAYRCPLCASGVKSYIGAFSLSGTMKKLKCTCGSELRIEKLDNGRFEISVPCLFCKVEHKFTVDENMLLNDGLFVYHCPYTSLELVFIGSDEKISAELDKTETILSDVLKQMGIDNLSEFCNEDDFDREPCDPFIFDKVMFVIKDLMETDSISCLCEKGDFDVAVSDDHIKVFCRTCGAAKDIPTDSELCAEAFCDCSHLKLELL